MSELNEEIRAAFEATSLILVFVTILFDLRYPKIQRDIRVEIPSGDKAKGRHREKLWQSLLVNCAPLLLINGAASYLFLPLFIRVLQESHLELWDFDFSRTSFVFITLVVFVFFLWSGYLMVQLVGRMIKSR
jgi:hypothetical protein